MAARRPSISPALPEPGPSLRALPIGIQGGTARRLLTDRQRQQLLAIASREHVKAGTVIYREGEVPVDVFICQGGLIKAFRELRSGARRVTSFIFPDDLFGLSDTRGYLNTLQAITAVWFYRLPLAALTELLLKDADLEFQFLCKITHELRVAQRRALTLGRRDAIGRVAEFLMTVRQHLSEGKRGDIGLPMTRADIADYLALSPEAVSRAARRLIHRGVVTFDGRRTLRVIDPLQLEKIVRDGA